MCAERSGLHHLKASVWFLEGFGLGILCICAYVLCDLPLLAVLRAGSAGNELYLIFCELFITNYYQCS